MVDCGGDAKAGRNKNAKRHNGEKYIALPTLPLVVGSCFPRKCATERTKMPRAVVALLFGSSMSYKLNRACSSITLPASPLNERPKFGSVTIAPASKN